MILERASEILGNNTKAAPKPWIMPAWLLKIQNPNPEGNLNKLQISGTQYLGPQKASKKMSLLMVSKSSRNQWQWSKIVYTIRN